MNLVAGLAFAAVGFAAGVVLIVFRVPATSAIARFQVRTYGAVGRRAARSTTPLTAVLVGSGFIILGILSLLLGLST
jgi:amino acid permease